MALILVDTRVRLTRVISRDDDYGILSSSRNRRVYLVDPSKFLKVTGPDKSFGKLCLRDPPPQSLVTKNFEGSTKVVLILGVETRLSRS